MKKVFSLVAGIGLLLITFLPVGAMAADNQTGQLRDTLKNDILNHTISKPINTLLEKKVTGTFNSHFKSNMKSHDTNTGTVYEQEPNDDPTSPNFNDNLPLGDVLLGTMDYYDMDFHRIDVTYKGENIFLTGSSDDNTHTLGFLLLDSNLNVVTTSDEINIDPDTGLIYEVMPNLAQGTYYAVAFDFTDPGDDLSYGYGIYATTLPNLPILNTVKEGDSVVIGTADPGDTISVTDGAQNVNNGLVDSVGNFRVPITPQKTGSTLSIQAYDPLSGITTDPITITVAPALDTTAPAAPKVNPIDDNDKTITGNAEVGSKITIKNGNTVIGTPVADSKTGNFQLGINPIKAGTVLSFTATDQAGNVSQPTSVTVADKTAPAAPKVNPIDDNDTTISGKAEVGSTVTIKNGSAIVGRPVADGSGNFKLGIKPIKAGTKLTFAATDKAGNTSGSTTVTVADKTAPSTPKVNPIDDNDKSITGKAEADSKVTIKIGSKVFSVVSVDKYGNFKLGIKPFKAGTKLTFTATDRAGNVSKPVTLIVADKTPPKTLTVNKVYHTSNYVKGKTEAYATITIKNGNKTLASKKADSKGNFTLYIPKQKKGSVLTVYASDASHNTRSLKVKVY